MGIAGDTAFFGRPVEALLEDRVLFFDAYFAYYTDEEPEHCWVASMEGRVVGFLLGCVEVRGQKSGWVSRVLPGLVAGLWSRRYRLGERTLRYVLHLARGWLSGEFASVDLEQYPSDLHINVDEAWRGRGIGRGLMEAYIRQLRELGVPGVHLQTTSLNVAAIGLYARMGFHLLATRATRIWEHVVDKPVDSLWYGLRLD